MNVNLFLVVGIVLSEIQVAQLSSSLKRVLLCRLQFLVLCAMPIGELPKEVENFVNLRRVDLFYAENVKIFKLESCPSGLISRYEMQ